MKFSANLSMLYQELPFLERIPAAAADGFTGVEFLGAYDQDVLEVRAALEAAGLRQVLFNVPSGDWAGGERGIACLPERVEEFEEGVARALEHARTLGCSLVNVLAGRVPEGLELDTALETLAENVRFAAHALAPAGVTVLLEAVNTRDVPGFALPTIADAAALLSRVQAPNTGLQFDVYHAQVMRGDLLATFERFRTAIQHVQIADNPGRHEPGTGEVNYSFLLPALRAAGYGGYIGAEYVPTTAGTGWLREFAPVPEPAWGATRGSAWEAAR
ncbi:Hydroxypyruvate isomerase [Kineococcus radiotolerans SRS30216 = ATCC BAA-149]|uniref:Hydroxypyruvate isomerase n=2 Tax=Kineococcus radiotolerans TaxID=131568 RepID=A6W9Y5_KINRD|nr:TIM barrel protein [Kineococcus radiotolerans]ABS03624.1 Hydroxypyruvate isomerase [Kineococcus radiotolerans SRS30216 = ATCC BAA-149]